MTIATEKYLKMTSVDNIEAGHCFDFGPLAATYDKWYATPVGIEHDLLQKTDLLCFLDRAKTGERLLDVGCGTGHWSRFFVALGYTVFAVDLSFNMVRVAIQGCSTGAAFQVADARALPFNEASFDIVASMATLEFLVSPLAALQEMSRCLRKGGRIFIGTLNRSASLHRQRLYAGQEPYVSGRFFSPEELDDLLRPFGRVRMLASHPDRAFPGDGGVACQQHAATNLNGPFIIAEVQQ